MHLSLFSDIHTYLQIEWIQTAKYNPCPRQLKIGLREICMKVWEQECISFLRMCIIYYAWKCESCKPE